MSWRRRPKVHKLARKGRTERLVAALSYRDHLTDRLGRVYDLGASVRRDAALALATVPESTEPDVGAALMRSLHDPSGQVRAAAAKALGARHDRRAVYALTDAALSWHGRYETARASAVDALAAMAGPDTAGPIVTTVLELGDTPRAIEILEATIDRDNEDAPHAVMAALSAIFRENSQVAERASEVLVWIGPESVEPVISALEGSRSVLAITTLGRLRDLRATDLLLRLLTEDGPDVRRAAANALGDISDPRARGALLDASGDFDYGVREAALNALRKLGPLPLTSDVVTGPDDDRGF